MELTELSSLLRRLSEAFGPSGRERQVRALIREEIAPYVDRTEVDALGNLFAYKAGDGAGNGADAAAQPRLRVMLAAHMDEVGLMITRIEKSGLLRIASTGIESRLLLAKRVVIGDDQVPGIIGAPVPHLQEPGQANKVVDVDDLAIDIGATSDKEAQGKVHVGDFATFATRFVTLNDDPAWPTVRGKAFDDRAGCATLIALLRERYPVDLIAVFSTQEEIGLRGGRVAGYTAHPDAMIALEGTICDDRPQPADEDHTAVSRLGAGPVVSLMDRSFIAHPGMLRLLRETAQAEGIAIQYKTPGLGGTDAGAVHTSRGGVPAECVATPCRYIHGPAAILNLNDLANGVRLLSAALRRIERGHISRDA